jgi:hypothetical protein
MKAISIRQPWASRILRGQKWIEVRTWATHHRGPLLICATHRPRLQGYPTGVALCVVQLVDCRPMNIQDETAAGVAFRPGAYAWVLGKVTPIEPFAVSGRLGLFDLNVALPAIHGRPDRMPADEAPQQRLSLYVQDAGSTTVRLVRQTDLGTAASIEAGLGSIPQTMRPDRPHDGCQESQLPGRAILSFHSRQP